MPTRKTHWETVYTTKADSALSWYTDDPWLSLSLISQALANRKGRIIDVGGGGSVLVDKLLEAGMHRPAVLDISAAALERAKRRLKALAGQVQWIVADVTAVENLGQFDVWHDRAVFHFLTDRKDRGRYVELAMRTIAKGGHAIIATFAPSGPQQCSGLNVCRYDADTLASEFDGLKPIRTEKETHITPWGAKQDFVYVLFQR